jgi:hypothetical protein
MDTTPTRTIGPVTTAAGGGAALSAVLAWLLQTTLNVDVPVEIQGAMAVLFVILAGWAVKPRTAPSRGTHAA